ncbi:MAG: hypothetical protein IPQ13_05815 [Holophagaceae bacterium]|nr:hypothetical protein [Holophagaceae bacterium]
MSTQDPNIALLETTAIHLRPLLDQVVFVGGSIVGLLITDPGASPVRATKDIDIVAEIAGPSAYYLLGEKLADLGFGPDLTPNSPVCRWRKGELLVDVMSTDENSLGFTNRWYAEGLRRAIWQDLPGGTPIRTITAPLFLLTKWEAFLGRGKGDYLESHDIEDFIAVVDGRPSLDEEVKHLPFHTREALAVAVAIMLSDDTFRRLTLPGLLGPHAGGDERLRILEARLKNLS